jgi:hypothetical protein
MEKCKSKCCCYGMFTGIYWVVGLGIVLGALLGIPFKANGGWELSQLAALLATGIALAYIVLSAIDWLMQVRALSKNPLPYDLALADRAVAGERLAALKGGSPLHRHIRRLLAAWSAGASGPQVATMAGNQMLRTLVILAAETVAILVLLVGSAAFGPPPALLTLGTGFMALVVLLAIARLQLASHLAGYIESHLLSRIGNDTPAAAGVEFAKAAAKSVSDSIASLVAAQTKFADQLAKSQQEAAAQLAKAQQDAAAQMAKAQQESSAQLAKAHQEAAAPIAKAHQEAASQVVKAQQEAVALIVKTQQEAAAQIAKAQQESSALVAKAQGDMSAKLSSTQEQSSAQLGKAQTEIAAQLGRVTALASTIDNVLKLQQSVDNTLKGVTVTDEFKSMLGELRRHLAESDQLLKNVSKPRSIRLVEKENE